MIIDVTRRKNINVMKKMNEILLILLIYFVMNEHLLRRKLKEKTIMTHQPLPPISSFKKMKITGLIF